jgi:hypothetical protein
VDDKNKDLERLKNPPALSEKEKNIQQVPFRIHRNDYQALKKLLKGDNWKLQTLFTAVVDAYMNRDPLLIKILADWKEENSIPKRAKENYSLSTRERKGILDELEDLGELEEG